MSITFSILFLFRSGASVSSSVSEHCFVEEKIVERTQQILKLDAMVVQQGRLNPPAHPHKIPTTPTKSDANILTRSCITILRIAVRFPEPPWRALKSRNNIFRYCSFCIALIPVNRIVSCLGGNVSASDLRRRNMNGRKILCN